MNEHTPHELSRRAVLSLLGVGGMATVGSIYSKVSGSHRASARSRESLTEATRDEWAQGVETTRAAGAPVATPRGSTIGFLYVPRLRDRVWGFPIVEGTDPKTLNVGIGHLTPLRCLGGLATLRYLVIARAQGNPSRISMNSLLAIQRSSKRRIRGSPTNWWQARRSCQTRCGWRSRTRSAMRRSRPH